MTPPSLQKKLEPCPHRLWEGSAPLALSRPHASERPQQYSAFAADRWRRLAQLEPGKPWFSATANPVDLVLQNNGKCRQRFATALSLALWGRSARSAPGCSWSIDCTSCVFP